VSQQGQHAHLRLSQPFQPSGLVLNSFEIKSAQLPLVSLLLKTTDFDQVRQDLLEQYGPFGENADFFDNEALVLDFSKLDAPVPSPLVQLLFQPLAACRLKPVAFRGCQKQDREALIGLGLVEAPLDIVRPKSASKAQEAKPPVLAPTPVIQEVVREVRVEVPGPATLVIDKPVRSGQKVYARGADLVVLAMVNQGGEVVADGNIHVYAPLRGKAMAGASGNTRARIFSLCLEPELISIAGVYRTSENPLAADIHGKPAQVRLSDDGQEKLLFEALNS
jgi:septum site-determining protein MinC